MLNLLTTIKNKQQKLRKVIVNSPMQQEIKNSLDLHKEMKSARNGKYVDKCENINKFSKTCSGLEMWLKQSTCFASWTPKFISQSYPKERERKKEGKAERKKEGKEGRKEEKKEGRKERKHV
jgi:hypothetical protein